MVNYSADTDSVEPDNSAGANTLQTISIWDFFPEGSISYL